VRLRLVLVTALDRYEFYCSLGLLNVALYAFFVQAQRVWNAVQSEARPGVSFHRVSESPRYSGRVLNGSSPEQACSLVTKERAILVDSLRNPLFHSPRQTPRHQPQTGITRLSFCSENASIRESAKHSVPYRMTCCARWINGLAIRLGSIRTDWKGRYGSGRGQSNPSQKDGEEER
jgi:hypothetical protein